MLPGRGRIESCDSTRTYSDLALGAHEFKVKASDAAGNLDASPASHSWTVEAPPPSCAASTVTVKANADSWVLQSSATSRHGSEATLKVDSRAGANARALVGFALPAIPAGCQLADVKLRLYAATFKSGRTLRANQLASVWKEADVNWNNKPAPTGTAATAPSPSAAGYVTWTVTAQVQSM